MSLFQEWLCQLSDLKLFTDYIINVTAVSPAGSSSFLSGLMMEDIGENWNYNERIKKTNVGPDHNWTAASHYWLHLRREGKGVRRGSEVTSPFVFYDSAVKPDPPVDVRVSLQNKRHLLVEWSPPSSWRDLEIFPLKYHIRYQWENRGSPKSVNVSLLRLIRLILQIN